MPKSSLRRAAVVTVALAALTVSCGTTPKPEGPVKPDKPAAAPAPAAPASEPSVPAGDAPAPVETAGTDKSSEPSGTSGGTDKSSGTSGGTDEPSGTSGGVAPGPALVRDAFAGLQATLGESCGTPGNCAYFLGRVHDELHGLDEAMKAGPKGPGHFPEPIAWIKKLDAKLAGDRSFENLKKNQKLLLGTRDRINTWMQGHPDDYR